MREVGEKSYISVLTKVFTLLIGQKLTRISINQSLYLFLKQSMRRNRKSWALNIYHIRTNMKNFTLSTTLAMVSILNIRLTTPYRGYTKGSVLWVFET